MPTTGYVSNNAIHSNYGFVTYDGFVIGRLDNIKFRVEKDVFYDVIIGSGGKPFGNPIIKTTKYTGTFTKGMIKLSELDKILMLDAIGNEHADNNGEHDSGDFSSAEITKFTDTNKKTLTIYPVALDGFTIALGGIVIKTHEIDISNNKFAKITGEFIGKFVSYFNKLSSQDITRTETI